MRILVAHNVSRERTGGMGRIMGFIHDRLVTEGHVVDYFCAEDVPSYLNGRLSRFAFPLLVRKHAVRAARSGKPYDIINIHEPSSAAVSILRRAMGHPKIVVTTHGVERRGWELSLEESRLGREGPALKTRVVYPLTSLCQSRLGLNKADHIFCLNFEDRDYLESVMNLDKKRITRIYPAANPIYASSADNRNYAKVDSLLFAGTWLGRKGNKDLVAAFTSLAEKYHDLRLKVLGGGLTVESLREDFPSNIRTRVSCIQTSSEVETAMTFAGADIYVLPSLFEGTPLTLMEAMTSGMPIVTTDTCGMKDVIRDGENGLLTSIRSPGEIFRAVDKLMQDEALRTRLGRRARAEALEHYTWDKVAMPVMNAYADLSGGKH